MANFGYTGCAALGALIGLFYGWVARCSSSHPLLSLRALAAILVLTVALDNEVTAGVYVTTLFQGACALLLFALLTMRRIRPGTARAPYVPRESVPGNLVPISS